MKIWWKRGILHILSVCLLCVAGCQNKAEERQEEEVVITVNDKVSSFFYELENWNSHSIENLNQLGTKINQLDSIIQFYPNINEYELGAFIFSVLHRDDLKIFEDHPFLKEDKAHQFSTYKVWRKKINNLKILDLSIEPHPTLTWIFVVRIRSQE